MPEFPPTTDASFSLLLHTVHLIGECVQHSSNPNFRHLRHELSGNGGNPGGTDVGLGVGVFPALGVGFCIPAPAPILVAAAWSAGPPMPWPLLVQQQLPGRGADLGCSPPFSFSELDSDAFSSTWFALRLLTSSSAISSHSSEPMFSNMNSSSPILWNSRGSYMFRVPFLLAM